MKARFVLLLILACNACTAERATREACLEIVDRIVEIELAEQGFRDAALAQARKEDMRALLAPEFARCENRRLAAGALACVRAAKSAEEISHICLR